MADVLVAGTGPAGWAAAAACAGRGLDTVLVGLRPHARWPATYGIWRDQCALLPAGSGWVSARAVAFGRTEHRLDRDYAVLDNESVRTALADTRVRVVTAGVTSARAGPRGVTVTLTSGQVLAAAVVIDATGPRRVLCGGPARAPRAEQTAFGVVLPARAAERLVRPGEAVFMDWRGSDGSTFLYAVPLPGDRVLVEETSLARRPGLGHPLLRARLLARLAASGVPAGDAVERVRFPVDLPVPRRLAGVIPFGAAAALAHPATGYSVADTFLLAPRLAEAIALGLAGGPGGAVRAAGTVLWSRRARAVRALRMRGLATVLGLGPGRLPEFFEQFFRLPADLRRSYLSEREDLTGTAAAMTAMFRAANWPLRTAIARSTLIV